MQLETARLKKYHHISEIMLRLTHEQKWTELWAIHNERNKLIPQGVGVADAPQSPEQTELVNKIIKLDNEIQTLLQNASDDIVSSPQAGTGKA